MEKTVKIYCRGEYHNVPANLHFSGPGIVEVDDWQADYLLRDAPENFSRDLNEFAAEAKAPAEAEADKMEHGRDRKKAGRA